MSLAASPMSQRTDYLSFFRRYGSYAAPPAQGYGQTAQVRSKSSLTIKTKFKCNITGFKSERVLHVWSVTCSLFVYQQGYTQQDYASYAQAQPAATDSAYAQTASSAGGYTQQQYAAAYGQSTTPGSPETNNDSALSVFELMAHSRKHFGCNLISTHVVNSEPGRVFGFFTIHIHTLQQISFFFFESPPQIIKKTTRYRTLGIQVFSVIRLSRQNSS